MNPIFLQNKKYSYRDPAAYYENGKVYLFFSLVENDGDNQYFLILRNLKLLIITIL